MLKFLYHSTLPRKYFDLAVITDIRFPGGSGSSTSQEIRIQSELGLTTALFHVPSHVMGRLPRTRSIPARKRQPAPKVAACLAEGRATLLDQNAKIYAPLTIIRHPTIANQKRFLPKLLKTDEIILVINHPAVQVGGRIDYHLDEVVSNIRASFGVRPKVCPISPVIGDKCIVPGRPSVNFDEYWSNVFDLPDVQVRSRDPGAPLVVGRHSRDDRDKWPNDAKIIDQVYPSIPGIKIRILGGARTPKKVLGSLPDNWEIHPFDPFGVSGFLSSIDVCVYFHHPEWVEAFGRAPCEAMMHGIPTIMPKYFARTFGEAGIYCEPDEVLQHLLKLKDDASAYEKASIRAREGIAQRFGSAHHAQRLRRHKAIAERIVP